MCLIPAASLCVTFSNPANLCKALGQLISDISATESETEIYNVVATYLPHIIPADRASVALVQPGERWFEVFALKGEIAEPSVGTRLPLDASNNVGRAFLSQSPCLSDVAPNVGLLQTADSPAIAKVMSAPLLLGQQVIGTINLASYDAAAYGASELELLTQVASLIVTNIERQRLARKTQLSMKRLRSYAERLEMLNDMGQRLSSASTEQAVFQIVADATEAVLLADRVSYAVPEQDREYFQIYALTGNDAIPQAARVPFVGSSIEAVLVQEQAIAFTALETSIYPEHRQLWERGLSGACSVPIQVSNTIVGVLNAGICIPWDYPEEALTLLNALGRFMGVTLERIQAQNHVGSTLAQLEHQASHDDLTGLPNRSFLHQALESAIEQANLHQHPLAVLFVDLDRFKEVNDSLSHGAGDQLLCAVARRMQARLRSSDLVARTGGDEFVVLLRHLSGKSDALQLADRLLATLRQPFHIEGHQIQVGGSIGISLFPEHGLTSAELMKNADIAMYEAKHQGRDTYRVYAAQMSDELNTRLTLGHDLRQAIYREEFFLLFQPQFDLKSGNVSGIESLLRWQHPTRGLVSPACFIPIAEEIGVIGDITAWVLTESLGVLASLRQEHPELSVSVNVSAQELLTPEVLTQRLDEALNQFDLPGQVLELELTERVFLEHPEIASHVMTHWKQRGICLAVDDFGTGFSSLNYLLQLPIDRLKIDRSFIQGIQSHERKQGVVKTILALGENLGATCIAEGVEEEEQLEILRQLGCTEIQGFLLAKPMPFEQLELLLKQNSGAIAMSTQASLLQSA